MVQNINGRGTPQSWEKRSMCFYGPGFIVDQLCQLPLSGSPPDPSTKIEFRSRQKVYRLAIQVAGLTGKETVIDAYCGIGTIPGIAASPEAEEVIGVGS